MLESLHKTKGDVLVCFRQSLLLIYIQEESRPAAPPPPPPAQAVRRSIFSPALQKLCLPSFLKGIGSRSLTAISITITSEEWDRLESTVSKIEGHLLRQPRAQAFYACVSALAV